LNGVTIAARSVISCDRVYGHILENNKVYDPFSDPSRISPIVTEYNDIHIDGSLNDLTIKCM